MNTNIKIFCFSSEETRVSAEGGRVSVKNICISKTGRRVYCEIFYVSGKETRVSAEGGRVSEKTFCVNSENVCNVDLATSTVSQILSPWTNPASNGRQVTTRWTCFILYSRQVYRRNLYADTGNSTA